jgi:hypothetical protein
VKFLDMTDLLIRDYDAIEPVGFGMSNGHTEDG